MFLASSVVRTKNASRYLQQLCKHFQHKMPVEYAPEAGECRFPFGMARLRAESERLTVEIEAPDGDQRTRTEEVIEAHLLRFAFREKLEPMTWRDSQA